MRSQKAHTASAFLLLKFYNSRFLISYFSKFYYVKQSYALHNLARDTRKLMAQGALNFRFENSSMRLLAAYRIYDNGLLKSSILKAQACGFTR